MAPDSVIDLEDFDNLVLRVKGDGRKYIASMRTEDWIMSERDDDVWQAFIFARCTPVLIGRTYMCACPAFW